MGWNVGAFSHCVLLNSPEDQYLSVPKTQIKEWNPGRPRAVISALSGKPFKDLMVDLSTPSDSFKFYTKSVFHFLCTIRLGKEAGYQGLSACVSIAWADACSADPVPECWVDIGTHCGFGDCRRGKVRSDIAIVDLSGYWDTFLLHLVVKGQYKWLKVIRGLPRPGVN